MLLLGPHRADSDRGIWRRPAQQAARAFAQQPAQQPPRAEHAHHRSVLAVGGAGGQLHGLAFLIELQFLNGKTRLTGEQVYSVLQY